MQALGKQTQGGARSRRPTCVDRDGYPSPFICALERGFVCQVVANLRQCNLARTGSTARFRKYVRYSCVRRQHALLAALTVRTIGIFEKM
jgi:hypothetical protein